MRTRRRLGAREARRSFEGHLNLLDALHQTRLALRRTTSALHRIEAKRARSDTRAWVVKRRERTRQLIELGGLIAKAGLIELTGDDRAMLYGALIEMAARLRDDGGEQVAMLWRRRGKRAFDLEQHGNADPSANF